MAKKMRTINNPLDRQTRNDINYNFGVLDNALEDMANSEAADNERFTRIENDVIKLKNEDKNLSDRIDANKQAIEDMDLDAIKLQGDTAEKQGIEAKKKGDKAEQQGNVSEQKGNVTEEQGIVAETKGIKAEQQGEYAKEMGDYAKEKAEYASQKTAEIEQAHTDLSQIKVEAVDATQNANTQANYAKEQGDYAKLVGDEVADKLIDIENAKDTLVSDASDAIEVVIEKGNITEQQGLKAKEQGDYAKEQGDYAKGQAEYAAEKTAEIEQAHTDLSEIKKVAIEATDEASKQANRAKEEADRAKPLVDAMEKELPNIENLKHVGSWNEMTEYKKNQEVLSNGSTYRALEDNKGTQPTDKSVWQLIAQRGVDGKGAVASVNGIMPDSDGNVDLGDIADKQYVDDKIGDVDLSALETKADAESKFEEAKAYTDEKIGDVDLSEIDQQLKEHSNKIASEGELGHIRVGNNMKIDDSGALSTKVASEDTTEWDTDDGFINSQLAKKNLVIHKENTLQGILKAHENNSFSVGQVRNVIIANESPKETFGKVGDIWMEVSDDVLPMKLSDVPVNAMVDIGLEVDGHKAWFTKLADNHYGQGEATLYSKDILWKKAFDAAEPLNENSNRQKNGNNNVRHSNLLQWLNSDEDDWFVKQHDADQAPTSDYVKANPYADESGFLTLLPKEVKENLTEVTRIAVELDIDGGGTKEYKAKVFPLSRTEIGLGGEREADGKPFPQFDSNESRIATRIGTATKEAYYLSTPYRVNTYEVRNTIWNGSFSYNYARNSVGVRPALTLSPNTPIYKISENKYSVTPPKKDGVKKVSNIFINTGGEL